MNDEIRAAVGAHQDLGPGYEDAVAEGLVERIGAEIDRRIDTRLGRADGIVKTTPAAPAKPAPATATPTRSATAQLVRGVVALGSLGLGVAATAILTGPTRGTGADIALVVVAWLVIMVVNIVFSNTHGN
jgi:hypothetical protein